MHQVFEDDWQESADFVTSEAEADRVSLCADFQEMIKHLGQTFVPILIGADPAAVPVLLEPVLIEELTKAAPSWALRPVLYGLTSYDYAVMEVDSEFKALVNYFQSADTADPKPSWSYLFLGLPTLERDAISLHAILLGHELGHVRHWYGGLPRDISLELKRLEDDDWNAFAKANAWVGEVVADIYSCITLGPVSLLALQELSGTTGPATDDEDDHPAPDRRLRLMVDLLMSRGFGGSTEMAGAFEGILDSTKDSLRRADQGNPKVWHMVKSWYPALLKHCQKKVAAADSFGWKRWPDVEAAARLLERGLPCSELLEQDARRTTDIQVILNATWLVKMRGMETITALLNRPAGHLAGIGSASLVLDDLASKSIEIQHYLRTHRQERR